MARNSRGKRPCSICRRWFTPDVRQVGRQKTCSHACQKERHRRQCEVLNKKNKADFRNNYLAKKLEKATNQTISNFSAISSQRQIEPVLPMDIVLSEYGIKPAIIIQYLVSQVIHYTNYKIREGP